MRGKDFAELTAFLAVVENSNFSRAAKVLNVSAPALSQIIRSLETRLGVRLLNRTTRSLSLTDEGQRLFAQLKPAVEAVNASIVGIAERKTKVQGTVKIHVPRIAFQLFIEPMLFEFTKLFPNIILDISIDDAILDIVSNGFDVGFRLGEFLEKDMVGLRLGEKMRQVPFASEKYLKKFGEPNSPKDLLNHNCILWRQAGTVEPYRWEFEKASKRISISVKGSIIVSDRSLTVQAALDGVGIGFWVDSQVNRFVANNRLRILLSEWCPKFDGFYLYYPKQREMLTAVRTFIDFMRSKYRYNER